MPAPDGAWGRSVYGMRIGGLDDVAELGSAASGIDTDLIPVQVVRSVGNPPGPAALDEHGSVRTLPEGRCLHLERAAGRATFYGPTISTDQLAHPYLGPIAVAFNRWIEREVFHAAAFVAAGRAWIVIGAREAGKSTLTAALAAAGVPILADDLVVTDGTIAYAGPRSVDLREAVPPAVLANWRPGHTIPSMSPSRLGTRLRVALPVTRSRWPIGGWVFLRWDEESSMEPVSLPRALHRLAARRCSTHLTSNPTTILALSAFPAWDLRRRRDWTTFGESIDLLLDTVQDAVETRRLQSTSVGATG